VLRGEVDSPELIDDLVVRARKVQGVQDVENLLHTPGQPAPMHD
jgi:osmotically-inducible protein OsmY